MDASRSASLRLCMLALNMPKVRLEGPADVASLAFLHPCMCSSVEMDRMGLYGFAHGGMFEELSSSRSIAANGSQLCGLT